MKMKPILVAPALVALLLSACGGGGGDGDGGPSVVDSHVGTWSLCGVDSDVPSLELRYVISKVDGDTASYQVEGRGYTSNDCSGTPLVNIAGSGLWEFKGTRSIGGQTVNLIEETVVSDNLPDTIEPRTRKDITLVSGNELFTGTETLGPDGYPTALDTELSLDRE